MATASDCLGFARRVGSARFASLDQWVLFADAKPKMLLDVDRVHTHGHQC